MAKKQDRVTYELKDGNKAVYVGTTNDPERREQEHKDEGKKFGHMNVTLRSMTEDGAMNASCCAVIKLFFAKLDGVAIIVFR